MAASPGERARATAAQFGTASGFILYALGLPMLGKAFYEIARGRFPDFAIALGLFVLFMFGATITRKGLKREAEFKTKRIAAAGGPPYKIMGGIVVVAATVLTSLFAARHGVFLAAAVGLGTALGYYLYYGLDVRGEKGVGSEAGVSVAEVEQALDEARGKIKRIEEAGKGVRNLDFRQKLRGLVASAQKVIGLIEEDPRDLRRARKFLVVYLDGAESVTKNYVATTAKAPSPDMDQRFGALLDDMHKTFDEQYQKLLQNDLLDLDVQMEVLQTRLKREGVM